MADDRTAIKNETPSYLRLYANGVEQRVGPADVVTWDAYEAIIRKHYERCYPDDTFDDLKKRASFSKEDKCILRDWMIIAASMAR